MPPASFEGSIRLLGSPSDEIKFAPGELANWDCCGVRQKNRCISLLLIQNLAAHGGLLVIVFDESAGEFTHGGGRIAWVVAGPDVKRAYVSSLLDCGAIRVFANWSGVAGDHLPVVSGLLPDVHYVEVAAAVAPNKSGFLRQE
jgi:hypothetical protein